MMKQLNKLKALHKYIFLLFLSIGLTISSCEKDKKPHNVLVVTGGKKIDKQGFLKIFEDMNSISFKEIEQPKANEMYSSPEMNKYDVLVFYDFVQEINEVQKKAFIDLLNKGKGILFLHHSLVSYQDWEEFEKITGGRYYQSTNIEDSMKYIQSTYRHNVNIPVQIVNKNHPVTKGLVDFTILDEIYGNYKVLPNVTPILTTTHPESEKVIGWTNLYGASKIVYIQLGHDQNSFNDQNYRQLIKQSIEWLAQKQNK